MKIVKRRLPEGVRKVFEVKIGKKVKVLNSIIITFWSSDIIN